MLPTLDEWCELAMKRKEKERAETEKKYQDWFSILYRNVETHLREGENVFTLNGIVTSRYQGFAANLGKELRLACRKEGWDFEILSEYTEKVRFFPYVPSKPIWQRIKDAFLSR